MAGPWPASSSRLRSRIARWIPSAACVGAARAVLVRDGCPEQRHHAVARVLVDRALEPVDLGGDRLEAALDDPVHLLGVEALGERGEPSEIGEEHGHLTPFTPECRAGLEDLLGQVLGGVGGQPRRETGPCRQADGRRGRGVRRSRHPMAALEAEFRPGR